MESTSSCSLNLSFTVLLNVEFGDSSAVINVENREGYEEGTEKWIHTQEKIQGFESCVASAGGANMNLVDG